MSRIGKQIITVPSKVEVKQEGNTITVKGPLGTLSRVFLPQVVITMEGNTITFAPKGDDKFSRSLWGTYAAHVKNMVEGVEKPFQKKLIVEGVGYKYEVSGKKVVLSVGFSHKVEVPIPEGLTVLVEKNVMTVSGIDKDKVGAFAAEVREWKKPEPYKGKGIRYEGEVVRRKEGKKTA
ncbi:MAG: 50S ribosomal protein L6 [Candidatus Yonathbacteria bacterium RIFCSPHIGHO2_01_FULL_51_10]|uniref:Large ribosomal subunit protein uL6 n=1 Tax=Candidatus Yonathbacteria bacterium RIFCSPHIGHO2_01_FULL_51_10 TaxID=1802723 RepID=A0A1G2S6J9_9BACT|nr:MAG: 50S ribosomal protein L6 [Candidatus Yonathbacteria bacterium RIFCSPHIGHO2_01_FULL_51_10]